MTQEKVLIVEDEENERTGLAELVQAWGYQTSTATDGVEGLETVESCPPYRLVRAAIESDARESLEFDLQPTATGTELRITESGDIPNPFMRFVSKYLMGHFRAMNNYERALALRFDEPAHIENMRGARQTPVMRSLNGTEQPCRDISVAAAR